MVKAVIFDLDGTIGNTLPLCVAAFRRAVEPLMGKHLTDEEIYATFGPSEEGTIMQLIPGHYHEGVESYIRYYDQMHHMCPEPFEGMKDIIFRLKDKGLVVALVTGKGARSCEITLRRYGLEQAFDMVETGSPEGMRKKEGIEAVLDRFGLKPEEAVYIGDAPSDITACREAGVPVISAAWAETADAEALEKLSPDVLIHSVAELREYLSIALA